MSISCFNIQHVALASEFVGLITTQRSFQANSKVITNGNEVLPTLIEC